MGRIYFVFVFAVSYLAASFCNGLALPIQQTLPSGEDWNTLEQRYGQVCDYAGNWCYKDTNNSWWEFPEQGEGHWGFPLDPSSYQTGYPAQGNAVRYFTFPGTSIGVPGVQVSGGWAPEGWTQARPGPSGSNDWDEENWTGTPGGGGLIDYLFSGLLSGVHYLLNGLPEWSWDIPDEVYGAMNYVAGFNRYFPVSEVLVLVGVTLMIFMAVWGVKLVIKVIDWVADIIP